MNLSPNTRPGRLLNGYGGSDDSTATSDSCLCVMTGLHDCLHSGLGLLQSDCPSYARTSQVEIWELLLLDCP